MVMEAKESFIQHLSESLKAEGTFIQLTLSKPGGGDKSFKNVYARLIELKGESHLSFTLRYSTRDITKNHTLEEGVLIIDQWLGEDFLNADLLTIASDFSLQYNRKRKPRLHRRKLQRLTLCPKPITSRNNISLKQRVIHICRLWASLPQMVR